MTKRAILILVAVLLSCVAGLTLGAGKAEVAGAAEKGDREGVRALIARKADVNEPQVDGATALHWAVYRNDSEMTDMLLRAGARVSVNNRSGISPLYMASLYGNPAIIRRLLKAGADAKAQGPNGESMLMLAARNGSPEAILELVAAGADVNAKEPIRGTTALMWAAEQKHPQAVKALLAGGADFKARSGGAGNPRNYMSGTVGNNNSGVQTAKLRLCIAANGGPSIEEQQKAGGGRGTVTPVEGPCAQYAVRGGRGGGGGFAQAAPFGAANAAPAAGEQAAAAGQPAPAGPQAAAAAGGNRGQGTRGGNRGGAQGARGAQRGATVAANTTAPTGAPADAPAAAAAEVENEAEDDGPVAGLVGSGGGGLTALIIASREGDLESVRALVDAGADVNQTSNAGWTPLLIATNNRNYLVGKFLIERGADVNKANTNSAFFPLYLATDNRNIEGGDYPVPKPDMDHLEFIKILLDRGANVNLRVNGNTETRTIFTMQWFFEAGATAFVRASQSGDVALMKLLLAHGADPRIAANSGDTALSAAAGIGWVEGVTYEWSRQDNVEAVRMLLDLGLDPNSTNVDGRTPLMGAALKGRSEVVKLLVERGANLDQRDKGSRDTVNANAFLAGHTWRAVDYADGLVRVGVQSAVAHPETGALIRDLMKARGMEYPPINRTIDSICIVEICRERQPEFLKQ